MVLNDIIEQAAGRHSGASEHGGNFFQTLVSIFDVIKLYNKQVLYMCL